MAKVNALVLKKIQEYVSEINSICQVDKAVLFGSYAKGMQKKDSDIDIAIFSKKINDSNRHKYNSLFLKHILRFRLDIQPVVFNTREYASPANSFIADEIKKRGKVIYSR
jgi:predicted nucleotidyltransferase